MKRSVLITIFLVLFFIFGHSVKSFFDYSKKSQAFVYRQNQEIKNPLYNIPTEKSLK